MSLSLEYASPMSPNLNPSLAAGMESGIFEELLVYPGLGIYRYSLIFVQNWDKVARHRRSWCGWQGR